MAADDHVFLLDRQLLAATDQQHFLDDVDAGDHLGDRVLHLYTGVHLDEVEVAIFIEELEGTRAAVADVDARLDAAGLDLAAGFFIDQRGWGFLDHLLVAALQRAVAVAQVNRIALAVGQHLDFHVAWIGEELLEVDHRVAEGGAGFVAGQLGRGDQVLFLVHHTHAATTTATGGLDDHRVAHFAGDAQRFLFVFRQWTVRTRDSRHAGLLHGVLGRHLIAHQADNVGSRADEGETGFFHLLGEVGVLGEEPVTGMDAVGTSDLGSGDDGRNAQVGLRGGGRADAHGLVGQRHMHQVTVGSGVHRHGLDAQFLAGAQDTKGDLAAVGDQYFFQHRWLSAVQTMVNSGWSYSTG